MKDCAVSVRRAKRGASVLLALLTVNAIPPLILLAWTRFPDGEF